MNIFEINKKSHEDIKNRAQIFVRLAANAIKNLSVESDQVPDFINSYSGFYAEAFAYDINRYVPNPNYKPGLTSEEYAKPENKNIDAGFSYITLVDTLCNVKAIEIQDGYEYSPESEIWELNSIPQDLFLNGSESEIIQFFTERFKESVAREENIKFENKYSTLFYNYTLEELIKYIEVLKSTQAVADGEKFEEILKAMKE